jgi:hypothetical protein
VVAYEPVRRGAEVVGVAAVALWALATRLLWPAGDYTGGGGARSGQEPPQAEPPSVP